MTDARTTTVAACQFAHTGDIDAACEAAGHAVGQALDADAALALLPEYWFGGPGSDRDAVSEGLVARVSSAHPSILVVGNELHRGHDAARNVCVVAQDGQVLGAQAKLEPTRMERLDHIVGGDGLAPIPSDAGRLLILVCADVLYPRLAADAGALDPDFMLVPVMSRARLPDPTLRSRANLFIARAFDTGSVVVKAGGYTADGAIAGRSLIAAPWGLLAQADRPFEDAVVLAEVPMDRLRGFRTHHAGFTQGGPPGPENDGDQTEPI